MEIVKTATQNARSSKIGDRRWGRADAERKKATAENAKAATQQVRRHAYRTLAHDRRELRRLLAAHGVTMKGTEFRGIARAFGRLPSVSQLSEEHRPESTDRERKTAWPEPAAATVANVGPDRRRRNTPSCTTSSPHRSRLRVVVRAVACNRSQGPSRTRNRKGSARASDVFRANIVLREACRHGRAAALLAARNHARRLRILLNHNKSPPGKCVGATEK